jgi:hypothetical protein
MARFNASRLRREMIIEGVLEHLSCTRTAIRLAPLANGAAAIVAFGVRQDGSIAYGDEITEASIGQVRIAIDGEYRYFAQVASESDKGKSGFSAGAWVETDRDGQVLRKENGTFDIRLCYPGYSKAGLNETKSMLRMHLGGMNPQVHEVKEFIDKVLERVDRRQVAAINIGSHSMGASNVLASHFSLQCLGISSSAIMIEPWGAGLAVDWLKKQMSNPASAMAKAYLPEGTRLSEVQIESMLTSDTISIRSALETDGALHSVTRYGTSPLLYPGLRAKNNRMVGKPVLLDMEGSVNVAEVALDPHHRLLNIIQQLATHGEDLLVQQDEARETTVPYVWLAEPLLVSARGRDLI